MSVCIVFKLKHPSASVYFHCWTAHLLNFAWAWQHSWSYSKLHDTVLLVYTLQCTSHRDWERDVSLTGLSNRHFTLFGNSRGGETWKWAALPGPAYAECFSSVGVSVSTQTQKPTSIHVNMRRVLIANVLLLPNSTEFYGKLLPRTLHGEKFSLLLGKIIS